MGVVVRPLLLRDARLQQVYLQAKDKVAFLGLDSRDVQDAARRFAAQTGVTYPLAADPNGQAAAKLGVAGSR